MGVVQLNEDISYYTIDNIVPLIHLINKRDDEVGLEFDKRIPIKLYITSAGRSAYDDWYIDVETARKYKMFDELI